ncbi:hypothetical protein NDU88_006149 [Pleurodeles waltl]|uniref:Retroelement silencing factor 1 n=2 Tax=Pleurodeles waltl TaxID=8319 RepID=A0AAV7SNS6_PLEWA|nr:hypothetical protein NDU88_006149 [Pleurodeles waltl]
MVHKKVLGAKDNFINARWHCNDKYMFRSVHSDGSLENADVHGSDTSPNICGNGLNGDSWSVVPHAATNSQTPEALSSYKTVYQQNLQTQSYSSQEENYVGQTSVGNTEGLHRLGLQTVKSSPTLTAVSSHRSQDQNEPALSNPFTNYLRNKYLTLEEVNKSHESVKKTKSSDFMEGVLSEQSQDQCALAHGLSASASKIRNNCQSGHPNLSTVPDRNGNPMEKELLKYSAREQTYKPMQNDTSDRGINLPSPNSKSTAPGSVSNTVASQTGSLPIVIAVKQEPIDLMQDKFHLDLCNKMASRTDKVDEQQPTRDVDPKLTLPPQGLCQQNDAVLHKSKKAVCLNEKTNAVSSIDVGNQCCDRAVTGRRPDLFGINIKKSTEPQIAVVNPLTPSKSESPSKDQENVPPRNGMYHASQEALRGPLSRKRKLAVVSTSGNIDHMSTVNMLLDILGSDAAVNCPGSQKVIPMTCDLNSKISDPQSKAKESAPAVDSTQSLLQLKSNEFAQPHTSPLCQEKPELQLVDGAVLLVNGACKEQLQISSVCTLVEGSTFYDSQIAKIFDAYSLEQSKDPDIELGELQKNKLMDIENKTCEPGVLDSPTEQRPRLDPNCKWKNQNNPVRRSNCSNQMILVSNSEPEQTVLEAVNKNKEAFVELAIANENGLSSSPFTSQIECCRNEGELEEQMTNMADSMQEEMPEGDEASSEPYLNSQLSELLRIFPFGIDTMETGATSEESDVLKEDKDGSNFSQLHEHEPDKENTVSSTVVGQAERTPPTIQAEVEKGLQSTNDCNIQSPDNDPKNGDTVDKEKGKPKSKDFQLVSGLESDRTVYSMQSEKLCSLQKQSIALLNSQHPGFLFRANGQPPCDTNRKCRENAKELTAMANGTGSNSNQVSSNAFVGMGTMQPVSYNFLLPVYSGEKKGFYVNNMATNSKTSSFKLDATYQNTVNQQIDEHSYFHLNSSSQINGNSEKIEDPATFHLTHQGKILQNCLPNNGVGWHKIEWVNSGKKLNCLPVEQNVYRSSDTRKSGTCEKGEQTRLMLQQVTTPTAGGAHSAFGCQDSIFKEHPPNTHAYHKVDRKSPSPKKHKEQSCLVGLSKEKKKKTRLIVKTDFLKPKANKAKLCQKPADVHGVKLIDDQPRVSENGCLKSMLSSDKCVAHSAKHGDNVKVSLSVNASCSVTDGGLIGEKRGVKEQACEESKDPRTVIYDAVVADDQLHNLAVQEFFQRRKAEQNTGGKKTQPAWEKHKAKQPVQYRKPSIILEKLEEGVKRKNEAGLEGNLSKHPKKAPQKPMESIGENFLTRIAFTGYENGVIQLVNFDFLNSLKNTLSLKAPKPVVAKPQTPEEEPKVLEFKLCPAELLGGHTADDESSGAGSPVSPDDSLSEESKNKGDASSSNIPLKKRKVDMALLQGNISVPKPVLNQDLFSTEKTSHPQTPNSKVLFNAFKKLYLETQSRNVA